MYTQGTDFTTGASTANYTTQQYQYQYQYQLPTTTQTTTTTQQFTTTEPVSYTQQQFTTSQPVSYTQSFTTSQPTYTQSFTTSQPDYTQSFTTQQTSYTTGIPGFSTGVAVRPTPAFKLLRQGAGISPTEQQGIVQTAMAVYQQNIVPISNNTASRIKKTLGGDWIVIVYPQGKPIDFNMTCVQGNDYMYFTLDNTAYQVCRLR
jgi:hypothetical protein